MKLFQSADALALTGLTKSQLREWCGRGRRELIAPDVGPDGPGRHALYSWQTLIVLRILRVLHEEFAAELWAWSPAAKELRRKLDQESFPRLWQLSVHFPNREAAFLIDSTQVTQQYVGIVIPLEEHLAAIATKLALPRPTQLPLFPAIAVRQ